MADSRRNTVQQRLRMKALEQGKQRETLYKQIYDIIMSRLFDTNGKLKDYKKISESEAIEIIQDLCKRTLEVIRIYKENNKINPDMLIPFSHEHLTKILDPILKLYNEICKESKAVKHEICLVSLQLFDNFSKHFCFNVEGNNKLIDVSTVYADIDPLRDLYKIVAFSCLKRNENIEQAKSYIKQYRKLCSLPDTPNREGVVQATNGDYYAIMALYSFRKGKHEDVKNYIQKADAAITMARAYGVGVMNILHDIYSTFREEKFKEKNYPEALIYCNLILTISEESMYQFKKIIRDHETGKQIRNELEIEDIKNFIEVERELRQITENAIKLIMETQAQQAETVQKETKVEVVTNQKDENNNNNVPIDAPVEKKKKSKKEKKIEKALALKQERDLKSDVSKKIKTIKFNENYIFSSDPKLSNTYRLFGVKHQYVAITPELNEQIKQLDPSIREQADKWIHNLCDVGKVLGNSTGMRGFLLNVKKNRVKVKDASKPWRIWGEKNPKAAVDDQGNQHTLWELKELVIKHD